MSKHRKIRNLTEEKPGRTLQDRTLKQSSHNRSVTKYLRNDMETSVAGKEWGWGEVERGRRGEGGGGRRRRREFYNVGFVLIQEP